jgi:hypothetical protein
VSQRQQGRGWNGHFLGFWARLNCEEMPVIPAWLVRRNLDDPRKIPYLLVWKDERHDGQIMEAVRLARYVEPSNSRPIENYVELKRADGGTSVLRITWRLLPRNGGRTLLLICSYCNRPRRHVYGWEWDSFSGWSNRVRRVDWQCRSCARLRYSSEGSALVLRGGPISRLLRMDLPDFHSPRPELWLPLVFSSPTDALAAGLCTVK